MSSKFHITDNQWYWDIDESKALNDLKDKETLKERGKYLVEIVDKIPDKASYHDIDQIPSGKQVITWGPSSGKTTAIRQWLFRNGAIYACRTILEIDRMYYDLMAMHEYKGTPQVIRNKIVKFHSKSKVDEKVLQSATTIICSHMRLYIEPHYILFCIDPKVAALTSSGSIYRSHLLIDEYCELYKSYTVTNEALMVNQYFKDKFGNTNEQVRTANQMSMISDMLSTPELPETSTGYEKAIREWIPKVSNLKVSNYGGKIDKIAYFTTFITNNIERLNLMSGNRFFYNITQNPVENIWIFDGTGDISLGTSEIWHIVKNWNTNKFGRNLQLQRPIEILPNTKLNRKIKSQEDLLNLSDELNNYVNAIIDKIKIHNKVLVYCWKSVKLSEDLSNFQYNENGLILTIPEVDKISSILIDRIKKIDPDLLNKVEFIYFNSGDDRATNAYSDCDAIMILGRFFIPRDTIADYNFMNKTTLSNEDNQLALVIQAIYRTQARRGKPISIYFSEDWNWKSIANVVGKFDRITCRNWDYRKMICNVGLSRYYDSKIESINSLVKYLNKNQIYLMNQVGKLIGLSDSTSRDNGKILDYLTSIGTNYYYYQGKADRTPSEIEFID